LHDLVGIAVTQDQSPVEGKTYYYSDYARYDSNGEFDIVQITDFDVLARNTTWAAGLSNNALFEETSQEHSYHACSNSEADSIFDYGFRPWEHVEETVIVGYVPVASPVLADIGTYYERSGMTASRVENPQTASMGSYFNAYIDESVQHYIENDLLPTSGGNLSGSVGIVNDNIDRDGLNPSSPQYGSNVFALRDVDEERIGYIESIQETDGRIGIKMTPTNEMQDGTTVYGGGFTAYVDKSGNSSNFIGGATTANGDISVKINNIDRDGTLPSSDNWGNHVIRLIDNDGENLGFFQARETTDGRIDIRLVAFNEVNGTETDNVFRMGLARDGTCSYSVTDPPAFRNALGASSGVWTSAMIPTLASSKISGLGSATTKDISSAVSLSSGSYKSIGYVKLDVGTWTISAGIQFASNATGRRYCVMTSETGTTMADSPTTTELRATGMTSNAVDGAATYLHTSYNTVVSSGTEYRHLIAWQNSGSALNAYGYIRGIRIA